MQDSRAPSSRRCDVFIAGAGLVGSTFARLFAGRQASIIMADAGGFHSRRAGENQKNNWISQRDLVQYGHFVQSQLLAAAAGGDAPEQDCGDYPAAMVSYAVGGMAVHWTCAIPEFHQRMEQIPFIDIDEWRRLYDRAAVLLNRHTDVFESSLRQQAIMQELTACGWDVRRTPMAAQRRRGAAFVTYTGADTVLGALADPGASDRFEIAPWHCVQRLVRKPGHDHIIEYAELRDIVTGQISRVYAGTFVVAAGWLHTAQILFASGIHTHAGSALGRYLSDHSFAACSVVLKPRLLEEIARLASSETGTSAGPGQDGIPVRDAPPHLIIPVSDARPWQGMIFRESYQFASRFGTTEDLRGIDLKWFGMIEPDRDNAAGFSHSRRDRLGMPAPSFRFRLGERDRDIQARMMADMEQVAQRLGPYRLGAEPAMAPLGSALHATGLTRMGREDDHGRTSVADPWGKVWGTDNLYLGGTTLIPTATASNPTFTAVALAIRSAEAAAAAACMADPTASGATGPNFFVNGH